MEEKEKNKAVKDERIKCDACLRGTQQDDTTPMRIFTPFGLETCGGGGVSGWWKRCVCRPIGIHLHLLLTSENSL